jgi:hypothetical protein
MEKVINEIKKIQVSIGKSHKKSSPKLRKENSTNSASDDDEESQKDRI